MKHLKFNFAVVIALLAIGITITSYANIFEKKKKTKELFADCYPSLTYVNPPSCLILNSLINNQTGCGIAQAQLSQPMFSNATLMDPAECSPGNTVFCCAKIRVGSQQCGLSMVRFPDGSFNYAVIDQVFCKALE